MGVDFPKFLQFTKDAVDATLMPDEPEVTSEANVIMHYKANKLIVQSENIKKYYVAYINSRQLRSEAIKNTAKYLDNVYYAWIAK